MVVATTEFVISAGMRNGQRDELNEVVRRIILDIVRLAYFAKTYGKFDLSLDEMSIRIHEDPLSELSPDGLARLETTPMEHPSSRSWKYYYQVYPADGDRNRVPIAEGFATVTYS